MLCRSLPPADGSSSNRLDPGVKEKMNVLEELESGETLNLEAIGESLLNGAIDSSKHGKTLKGSGGLLVFRGQLLAVSAPRGLERVIGERRLEKVKRSDCGESSFIKHIFHPSMSVNAIGWA